MAKMIVASTIVYGRAFPTTVFPDWNTAHAFLEAWGDSLYTPYNYALVEPANEGSIEVAWRNVVGILDVVELTEVVLLTSDDLRFAGYDTPKETPDGNTDSQ